ncbi:hypothetical protein [Brevibacillus fulvus]|uniref:SLH domain-containing protein n=1 Tax=Brevibacillus fulvus TaxID=1125967 RepID=A0A938XZK5_9BACL|nr:hypothetical protein [Brevibacillus fulvus]MBM7588807.1 hypothetical protein [Brevibacillus fulvus]
MLKRLKQSKLVSATVAFSLLAAPIGSPVWATAAAAQTAGVASPIQATAERLKSQYGVDFSATVSQAEFLGALKGLLSLQETSALLPEDLSSDSGHFSSLDAVRIALRAAKLEELAQTYPEQKVKKAGIPSSLDGQAAREVAAAADTGLLPSELTADFSPDQAVTDRLATALLGKVLEFRGLSENFLGYVSDDDIYSKVYHAWQESQIIKADKLQNMVNQAVEQDLVTGYNLKDLNYAPHFDPTRTITYGHSDITHAIQLLGLLRSEGLDAKVQLEPKTSAFKYLPEWGEPQQSEDYQVIQIKNGNLIAYSKEYDLSFEFADKQQKERFDQIILSYAKKNQEDASGLLYQSWWQPLYYSLVPLTGYEPITNNWIEDGRYLAQSFSLTEQSANVVNGLKKIAPSVEVSTNRLWVNTAFYHYLQGDYK